MAQRVDVLIPVYNSMHLARPCIESVLRYTDLTLDRVTVLDDCSDSYTAHQLDELASTTEINVLHNQRNVGFVRNCNRGMETSTADYVILLNSDTCVTAGWSDKMVDAAQSDPSIGVASPISNFAPHMRIDMVPGLDFNDMNALVEELSPRSRPDITTPEGFCFLITKRCMQAIGYFDLAFDDGYGEESDYSMRANAAGFRTICVDDTYIYHRGRGTFGHEQRDAKYQRNKDIFRSRWADRYRADFTAMKSRKPLKQLRLRIDEYRGQAGPGAFVR